MITVLVVEDNQSEQDLLSQYLQEGGYDVVTANNGKDALEKIKHKNPNVIVTDLVMPDMDGLQLCRSLKKDTSTTRIPIIACTSKNQDLDRLWAMKQGIEVYLTKPFSQAEIVKAIKSVGG